MYSLSIILFLLLGFYYFYFFYSISLFVSAPGLRVEQSFAGSYMNGVLKSITVPVTAKLKYMGASLTLGFTRGSQLVL